MPRASPADLARERAATRAGASYVLKADVSQFYPSLYTHAIGWAIDPKLRNRRHWANKKLLGKRLDQALMDLDGKVSQGVPIGNDISFLLAEIVLARVDKAIKSRVRNSFRWFDDYELAFDTREQSEEALKKLNRELAKFRLRLNTRKTEIKPLPHPAQDEWQEILKQYGTVPFTTCGRMVRYFDAAFRLREKFPSAPVLLYALGILFNIACPRSDIARIAQSCITQAVLCEPGAAQKAFALLSYWRLNGLNLDTLLITDTINRMIIRHQASGFSSDCAWALAFCLENCYTLDANAGRVLSAFDDDCIALQTLHMQKEQLLPKGFNTNEIVKGLKDADLDREHWLLAYETVRHGFLPVCEKLVKANPLFSRMLRDHVTFYRIRLPQYAGIVHPGGAPSWVVREWLMLLLYQPEHTTEDRERIARSPVLQAIRQDIQRIRQAHGNSEGGAIAELDLMDILRTRNDLDAGGLDAYSD